MKKYFKIIFPIFCVLVVIITFYMIFDIQGKVEEINYGTNDIKVNEITDVNEESKEEEIEDYLVENEVLANTAEVSTENIIKDTNNVKNTTIKEEVAEEDDSFSKTKLDQAINLVQKAWGKDNSVYFTNEGINSDGLYMVAVRDKASTAVKNYFKVNLDTKNVEIDY